MNRSPTIHVAGAGALGLACALRLAEAGAKVTVFDPALGERSASAVAAGMLAPVFEAVLDTAARPHFDLLVAARDLWPDFAERSGVELDRRGAMAVGDGRRLATIESGATDLGAALDHLSAQRMGDLAPGLSREFRRGVFTTEDWRLDGAASLASLRRAARAAGVEMIAAEAEGPAGADILVVATGAGQGLAADAPEIAALEPIKGHILRLPHISYDGVVVRGPTGYAAPSTGGLTVGATMEAGVADTAIDAARTAGLVDAGRALFPDIAGASVVALAGVRAATADGLPLVGPSANPRILLAAGARRNGWLLAPMVGRMVAAYAFDRDPGPWADRMIPARFG